MRKVIDLTKEYTEDELEEFMCDLEDSMEKEQGRFLKKLEGKSPKEILDAFSYQYMIQADFLYEVSEGDALSAEEIAPLLASAHAPWKGIVVGVFEGDTAEELYAHGESEGLFYQLFTSETGERIGYGVIDPDSLDDDIERFEVEKLASKRKD